jgi:hypothetical protein
MPLLHSVSDGRIWHRRCCKYLSSVSSLNLYDYSHYYGHYYKHFTRHHHYLCELLEKYLLRVSSRAVYSVSQQVRKTSATEEQLSHS